MSEKAEEEDRGRAPEAPRDRAATEARLLEAAGAILAETGAEGLGVNAVARRAGCDKQLIYRYFGGLAGLCDALGAQLGQEMTQALVARAGTLPAGEGPRLTALLRALAGVLRDDPRHRALTVAAAAPLTPALERLMAARGEVLSAWVAGLGPPSPGGPEDRAAIHALLIGAVEAAVAGAARNGRLAGLPLGRPKDWERLEAALARVVAALYAGARPG